MNRITRNRRLTPDESAKYNNIREQVVMDLPDLITRHRDRMATFDKLQQRMKVEIGEHETRP